MRTFLTIGYDAAGKSVLISGPEAGADAQRDAFEDHQSGKLPDGIVRTELWISDRGRAKKAICPKHHAKLAAEEKARTKKHADDTAKLDEAARKRQAPSKDKEAWDKARETAKETQETKSEEKK